MQNTNLNNDPVFKKLEKLLLQKKLKVKKSAFLYINGYYITGVNVLSFFYKNRNFLAGNNLLPSEFVLNFIGFSPTLIDLTILKKTIQYLLGILLLLQKQNFGFVQRYKELARFLRNLLDNITQQIKLTVEDKGGERTLYPSTSLILNKKNFYTYRLTCLDYTYTSNNTEIYYMGYRSTKTLPAFDLYYSSSKSVQRLIASLGRTKFKKKILGLYAHKKEALNSEVLYHKKLNVAHNKKFLNRARQTTTSFAYDHTGTVQTFESNLKRSKALLGKSKMTADGKARVASYQKNERKRSIEECKQLSKGAVQRNSQTVTCPHCGKVGQSTAMRRWHFDRCLQAPNPSVEGMLDRENVRQNAIKRNQKSKNTM